jgi:transposase-like protein
MRHTPEAIWQFIDEYPRSGQTVADFCDDYNLKVPTFYSWKRKYNEVEAVVQEGFYKIRPKQEIAELILEINRAHA